MDIRSKQTDARIAEAVARRVQGNNGKKSIKEFNPGVQKAYANVKKQLGKQRATSQKINVPERAAQGRARGVISPKAPINSPERFKNYGQAKKAMRLRKSKINLQAAAKMRLAASRRSK
jgi:hypothetical protein